MARVEEEKEELGRILKSPHFSRAPRLQKFLRFVCECYFSGSADQINEYLIAIEVFGKKADFHASEDSIVRVEAGDLRRRLRDYYQCEGRDSSLVLDLPVGGYIPRFIPSTERLPTSPPMARMRLLPRWSRRLAALVALALLSFGSWKLASALRAKDKNEARATSTTALQPRPLLDFWDRFLAAEDPTIIVLSNPPVFRFVGEGDPAELRSKAIPLPRTGGILPSLGDEINARDALLLTPAFDQYTGIGEAMALYSIARTLKIENAKLDVKQSRTLSGDDLKHHNLILLGGSVVNLWTGKLGQTLAFVGERGGVSNLRAGKGEQSRYAGSVFERKSGRLTSDYAVIAVQHSSATGHWVLLLFGGQSEGTQGAAEAITDERFLADLLRKVTPPSTQVLRFPESFQVLLGVKVDNGIPERATYLAHHVL